MNGYKGQKTFRFEADDAKRGIKAELVIYTAGDSPDFNDFDSLMGAFKSKYPELSGGAKDQELLTKDLSQVEDQGTFNKIRAVQERQARQKRW